MIRLSSLDEMKSEDVELTSAVPDAELRNYPAIRQTDERTDKQTDRYTKTD